MIGIGVPLAVQNAVMRHRLYDLDVVVKKTVMFAIVVVLLVAVGGIIAVLVAVGIVPSLSDSPALISPRAGVRVDGHPGIPARVSHRRPGRVRRPGEPVRGTQRVLRTAVGDLRHRRRAAADGRDRGGSHPAKEVRVWLRVSGVYRVAASWPAGLLPEDPVVDPGEAAPVPGRRPSHGGARPRRAAGGDHGVVPRQRPDRPRARNG